jgi:hypothetical protein
MPLPPLRTVDQDETAQPAGRSPVWPLVAGVLLLLAAAGRSPAPPPTPPAPPPHATFTCRPAPAAGPSAYTCTR